MTPEDFHGWKGGSVRVGHDELILDGDADDVPRARHYAAAALRGGPAEPLLSDVELVVSELVTNALLHAGAPARLRVLVPSQRDVDSAAGTEPVVVRVEVRDPMRTAPVRAIASTEAMTGRGIALIEALASSWGVEQDGEGKVVWSELSTAHHEVAGQAFDAPGFDIDALLAAWDDEPAVEQRFTVRLGDVPTELLLAAKAHVDNLVREFTLAAAGAESGYSSAVPIHLATLVETVVHRFAEPRRAIKRQAVKAAAAGLARTDLILTLTPGNVEAGEAYLAALDEADTYARAARLLTLETPAQHRVFRRWYVESLIGQVAAAQRGEPTPSLPSQSFEARLLDEVGVLSATKRATERAARLQEVTAALGTASTPEEVAHVVVTEGVAALGATGGSVLLPRGYHRVSLPGAFGYDEPLMAHLRDQWAKPVSMWPSRPVWIETRQERDARMPELTALEPTTCALCTVPLTMGGRTLGALRFSFDHPRLFDEEDRRFIVTLAGQTAQALERSLLFVAERAARTAAESLAERLARLQRVTAELTSAVDLEQIADIIVVNTAEAMDAALAALSLRRDEDTLELTRYIGDIGADPSAWRSFPIQSGTPSGDAVLTRSAVVVPSGELAQRYPEVARRLGAASALVVVPMRFGSTVLGTLSLTFRDGEERLDEPSVLSFLQTLADASAQAIQQYGALAAAEAANGKLAFLAEASRVLSSSRDRPTILSTLADLVVPRIADLCVFHLVTDGTDGTVDTVAIAHIPSDRLSAVRHRQQAFPVSIDDPTGVGRVIRTGLSELYSRITEDDLVAGAKGDELQLAATRALALSSVLVVPIRGRTGVIGAIGLVQADSGRRYDETDQTMMEDLGRRAGVAIENAEEFRQQSGRLAEIAQVAEAARRAILAPVPSRVGPALLSAAYLSAANLSAAQEALIGGAVYEVVRGADGVRLLVGDVRGKGVAAVRVATIALAEFRAAAADEDDLEAVAVAVDRRLAAYLTDEHFVTALMVDLRTDGLATIVCCGHPAAIISRDGELSSLACVASVPLGLGARPVAVTQQLSAGDRLLLFTDGLVEVRRPDGQVVDLAAVTAPLSAGALDTVLTRVLEALRHQLGHELGDDVALLAVEYQP